MNFYAKQKLTFQILDKKFSEINNKIDLLLLIESELKTISEIYPKLNFSIHILNNKKDLVKKDIDNELSKVNNKLNTLNYD